MLMVADVKKDIQLKESEADKKLLVLKDLTLKDHQFLQSHMLIFLQEFKQFIKIQIQNTII